MPEPVNIDLTARVAAEERARRADLAPGERSMDILVIDDQPDHEAGWFARHLPSHRRLSLESVGELERYLASKPLPNLPPPPYRPELAILDLSLGAGEQPGGVQALHILRRNPATRDLPAILNTNGLEDHRDLLAVLAAQVNGGAIPVAQKTSADGPFVRDHACRIAHANDADLSWPLAKAAPGLLQVQEVFWHGDKTAPVSLLAYLLDLPWKRTYWTEMARHRNHQDAAFEARKRHGTLTPSTNGGAAEPEARKMAQNHARFVANQFGPLAVAWDLAGGHLHQLGGRLSLTAAQQKDSFSEFSAHRSAHLVAFATRYGPVLADPFIQSLLDRPVRLRPQQLLP